MSWYSLTSPLINYKLNNAGALQALLLLTFWMQFLLMLQFWHIADSHHSCCSLCSILWSSSVRSTAWVSLTLQSSTLYNSTISGQFRAQSDAVSVLSLFDWPVFCRFFSMLFPNWLEKLPLTCARAFLLFLSWERGKLLTICAHIGTRQVHKAQFRIYGAVRWHARAKLFLFAGVSWRHQLQHRLGSLLSYQLWWISLVELIRALSLFLPFCVHAQRRLIVWRSIFAE